MLNVRALTSVASLSVAVFHSLVCDVARAEESTSAPAPDSATVAEPAAPSVAASMTSSPPKSASTPSPTTEQPASTRQGPVKWRPLVLRSEIPPDQRPIFGSFEGTYVMVGPNVGMGLSFSSLLLGGEVSVVRQTTEFAWFGAYLDGVHDFAHEQTRFSIGPELGWSALGLDAGYLLQVTPSGVSHGVTVRPLVSMGYATLFGRFCKNLSADSRIWAELGVLLKYPIEL